MRILYAIFGLCAIAGAVFMSHRGTVFLSPAITEVRAVPKSVRDNPGSYRPVYARGSRGVRGGK